MEPTTIITIALGGIEALKALAQAAASISKQNNLTKEEAKKIFLDTYDANMAATAQPVDPVKP